MGQPCKHMLILTKPIMNLMKLALALLFFTMAPVNCGKIKCCKDTCTAADAQCDDTDANNVCRYTQKKATGPFTAKKATPKKTKQLGQAEMTGEGDLLCELACDAGKKAAIEAYTVSDKLPLSCNPIPTVPVQHTTGSNNNNNNNNNGVASKIFAVSISIPLINLFF